MKKDLLFFKMVKRCCYGTCNTDNRFPERLAGGVRFLPFPKPKQDLEKCLRWIICCGRPYYQFNVGRITRATYICTKVNDHHDIFKIFSACLFFVFPLISHYFLFFHPHSYRDFYWSCCLKLSVLKWYEDMFVII